MPHDKLFKELLHAFFVEFLQLFFPEVAARLDFTRVEFLDRELFTDIPEGSRREADVVAQVLTLDGQPELILVHIEVQAKRARAFPYRMFEYYALLRLRYKVPVFPVVLYLAPGAGGLTREEYTEGLFGEDILRFRYRAIGLPDLSADDYREQANPLAALSALMQPSQLGRLVQKYRSIRQALASPVDEARKALLVNLIEQYLPLNAEEETEFAQLLGQADTQEVKEMLTVYEERGIVKGKRDTLQRLLRRKFGDLPEAMITKIQAIQTEAELDILFDQALDANSLEEIGMSDS
jgi:hypothetical protein